VYCFTLAYFLNAKFVKKAKLRMKNWEMKLFLGIGMAKSSYKKKEKSADCHIWL
jgi:hypothetical protein